jgi:hypothetical protein
VRLQVTSTLQAVNAVSGTLAFPTDKLQVTSVSKSGSILTIWVQDPSFSNSQGTVDFEGVVPNPGFKGSSGTAVTVTFKVVGTGTANIRYSSGSILANDGYGTNILNTLVPASFTLTPKAAAPAVTQPEPEPNPGLISNPAPEEAPVTVTKEEPKKTLSFELPSFDAVAGWVMKLLSLVIPLFALLFLLTHTWHKGVSNVRDARRNLRKDLHTLDRLVEKSFDIIKEDISDSINMLERARVKRKLTPEEDAIIHRLRQNLVDAERIIHKEVIHAEKDIGD